MIATMNRLSALAFVVGCLAIVSRGLPVAPSSAFAQEKGRAEAAPDEKAAEPEAGEEEGAIVSDPHGSPADDDSGDADPGTDDGNGEDNGDDGTGSSEATSRPPADGSQPQRVAVL
jgi:hypothetical protein